MIPDLRPITGRALSRLRGTELGSEAKARIEIDPPSRLPTPSPIALPDELDRVIGHYPGVDPGFNLRRLCDQDRHQPATTAYRIDDVVIADGTLLTRRNCAVLRDDRRRAILLSKPEVIPEAVICTEYVIERYFGHWVADGWGREQLALDREMTPLVLDRAPFPHEPGYRDLIDLHPRRVRHARVNRLWFVDDGGMNEQRMARLDRVRQRLRAATPKDGPARVFITRGGNAVGRALVNEAEVVERLSGLGFEILRPEDEAPIAIAGMLASASLVVAVEGSANAHAVAAMPAGAGLLTIQSPTEFNSVWRAATDGLGQRFGFTIGRAVDETRFAQPVDRLLRTIDLFDRALG